MAEDSRRRLLELGANGAEATAVSGTNDDGTTYSGQRMQVVSSVAPALPTAATPTAIASGTGDAQGVAAVANLRLLGYSVRESAVAPDVAALILRHGTSVAGGALAFVELGNDQSVTVWFGGEGIACANGIFVDRESGETEIVLYTKVAA